MTYLVMAILVVCAAMLQALLPALSWLGQAKCPLLLSVTLYYSLERDEQVMLLSGVAAGLAQDALSPIPLGYSCCAFCLVGWGVSRFRKLVLTDSTVTQAFFGFIGGAVVTLVLYLLLLKDGLIAVPFRRVLLKILGSAIMGMLVVPPLYWFAGRFDRLVGNIIPAREVEGVPDGFDGTA